MESLEDVDRMMMSGTRATLVLKKGAELTEDEVKQALASKKLKFDSLTKQTIEQPEIVYVAKTPKFT